MKLNNAKLLLFGVLIWTIPVAINFLAEGSFAQQQDLQYSCPMHPEVKSKKAGSCPKCGMTLKKPSAERSSISSADVNSGTTRFPNVELITQDGKKVRFYDDLIKGKVVAIELMYTTCRYNCPLIPGSAAVGRNTAISTSEIPTTGPNTSSIARDAASLGGR